MCVIYIWYVYSLLPTIYIYIYININIAEYLYTVDSVDLVIRMLWLYRNVIFT